MVRSTATPAAPPNGKPQPPLLDLNDLAPTRYVTVHKKRYAMVNIDSLGLIERAKLNGLRTRVTDLEELADAGTATPDDVAEYEVRVRELAQSILPTCPPADLDRVPVGQVVALDAYFFVLVGVTSPLPRGLMAIPSMMGRSSPGSPTTTAAARGSSRRRSRS